MAIDAIRGHHQEIQLLVSTITSKLKALSRAITLDLASGYQATCISDYAELLDEVTDPHRNKALGLLPQLGAIGSPSSHIISALNQLHYDEHQLAGTCYKFPATAAVNVKTLLLAAEVNEAKDALKDKIKGIIDVYRKTMGDKAAGNWRDNDEVIKAAMKSISKERFCYRQLIRHIPLLNEKPNYIHFMWKPKPSIVKKTAREWLVHAQNLCDSDKIPEPVKEILKDDIQSLNSIQDTEPLIQRRGMTLAMVCNAKLPLDTHTTQLSVSLPVLYLDTEHRHYIPVSYTRLFVTSERAARAKRYHETPDDSFPYLKLCRATGG